ncbi:restriction endonuclease subunit S [Marinicella litoralis]|uniref:Type I restriction enzyme S subunit n=1 Tax=Marinicella litoralis TaxID=644220 RepID=A0A4R6XG23_9GAMM|nr:restriction endonuclease subunit S [Marinicella litoralis]TDR16750.1 type I restriction enzyme S subunit [Marinicella litoralis]
MSKFPREVLGELITHQKGFAFKSKDYQETGIPVVRVSNFTDDSIDTSDLKFVSKEIANENQKVALKTHDVIIATVGSWPKNPASIVGKTICVPSEMNGGLMNQNSVILRVNSQCETDQKYLFIALKTKLFSEYLVSTAQGSANQASVTLSDIFSYEVEWPEPHIRRSIVSMIDSINQKIELNRQTNQTLEQIAQAIFKSWFVDFEPTRAKAQVRASVAEGRIPGSDQNLPLDFSKEDEEKLVERAAMAAISGKTPEELDQLNPEQLKQLKNTAALFPDALIDSELGEIPEGWEVKTFGEVSKCFDSKRVPLSKKKREEKKPGNIPYYGATSVMDYLNEYIFDDIYLLLGEDGSVIKEDGSPFVQYIWGKAWVNNHAHVLQGINNVSTEHLMIFIQSQNIAAFITGAVQLKLNQGNMNNIPFLDAGKKINNSFYKFISPLYEKVREISEENKTLMDLRDALLPKLLSGNLAINEVTI